MRGESGCHTRDLPRIYTVDCIDVVLRGPLLFISDNYPSPPPFPLWYGRDNHIQHLWSRFRWGGGLLLVCVKFSF